MELRPGDHMMQKEIFIYSLRKAGNQPLIAVGTKKMEKMICCHLLLLVVALLAFFSALLLLFCSLPLF